MGGREGAERGGEGEGGEHGFGPCFMNVANKEGRGER